jgi:hypothetical protein
MCILIFIKKIQITKIKSKVLLEAPYWGHGRGRDARYVALVSVPPYGRPSACRIQGYKWRCSNTPARPVPIVAVKQCRDAEGVWEYFLWNIVQSYTRTPNLYEHLREVKFKKLTRWILRLTKSPHTPQYRREHRLPLKKYFTFMRHQSVNLNLNSI